MSVALLITKAGQEDEYQPVATGGTFLRYWLPVIETLQLEWLPLFQGGAPLAREDLAPVLAELGRFTSHVRELAARDTQYGAVHQRAVALSQRLESLVGEEFDDVFVG